MRRNNLKTLKVTIENLQQVKNGVVCGEQVAFKVMQAGRVLVERVISGKTSDPFTLAYDVSADDEPLVVEHDRPDLQELVVSAAISSAECYKPDNTLTSVSAWSIQTQGKIYASGMRPNIGELYNRLDAAEALLHSMGCRITELQARYISK